MFAEDERSQHRPRRIPQTKGMHPQHAHHRIPIYHSPPPRGLSSSPPPGWSWRTRVMLLALVGASAWWGLADRPRFTQDNIQYSWVAKTVHPAQPPDTHTISAAPLLDISGPPFQYIHMGMIEKLPNQSFAVIFQAGLDFYEGGQGQALYWTSSIDAINWSPPQPFLKDMQVPLWSPVLHVEGGRVWAFFSRSSTKCKYWDSKRNVNRFSPGGDVMYVSSNDSGLTWTPPQMVYSYEQEMGMPKVLANKLAVLSNGGWALPFWREPGKTCPIVRHGADPEKLAQVKGSAGLLMSGDQGLSWQAQGHVSMDDTWLIENSVVQLTGQRILQLFRTKLGYIYHSLSHDGGVSWTSPGRTSLQNPNSKAHLMRIRARKGKQDVGSGSMTGDENEERVGSGGVERSDGIPLTQGPLVCAYNNSPKQRTPLVVAMSRDEGRWWHSLAHIETKWDLQFAYPTMLEADDRLYTVYTVMRTDPNLRLVSLGLKVAWFDLQGVY